MPEVQKRAGMFTWTDLNTPDTAAAKEFYGGLFGWEAVDVAAGGQNVYTMFRQNGKEVAGMGQQPESMKGMPALWTSYITVDDVDAVAARAQELGGTLTMAPMDVMDAGRMALIQDPTGAVVAVWQPGSHAGAELFNEPGAMSWNELATRDPAAAKTFYEQLFGWTIKAGDVGGGASYTGIFLGGDHPNGGIIEMTEQWPPEVPPHWMTYFSVADVAAAAAKAEELGGSVRVAPQDIPVGCFSVISDPHGATFTVFAAK